MKYSVKYKRVFDKDENIVDISTVTEANRLSEYYSIGSHTPMIAALGQINQHYFRAKRGYQFNPETELHEYVKRVLKHRFETEDHFLIKYYRKEYCPNEKDCIFYDKLNKRCEKLCSHLCEYDLKDYFDTATIEGGYDGFVADVLLTSSSHNNRRPVFLEVAVTHPCTEEKKASGHKIIELFVSCEDDAYCELKQAIPDDDYLEDEDDSYCDFGNVIFYNFEDKIKLQGCAHFVREKKYAKQPYTLITTSLPTKFYCIPQQVIGNPIHAYYENAQIGMLFASNSFAKPFVFDKAISQDGRSFVMMGKDIYGAVKSWVIYAVTWNGKTYYHKVFSHFDYESALKDFTILQGRTWLGGETLSDRC